MNPNSRMEWAKGSTSTSRSSARTSSRSTRSSGCSGSAAPAPTKTAPRRPPAPSPSCSTWLASSSPCSATARPAPATPARRAGNEFVFQGLATQNVEVFKETKVKKVVSTCAHCFNTLKNEYKDFGIELEVTHHTQLLNRLVREKKLTPVAGSGWRARSITYHDPCYLGRHNQVYSPPRELLNVIPGAELKEMPRNSERSFCCGAGGARMWMEETIGERINVNRTQEAVATGADQIAVGCPQFCRVMLSDGLTAIQAKGEGPRRGRGARRGPTLAGLGQGRPPPTPQATNPGTRRRSSTPRMRRVRPHRPRSTLSPQKTQR
jgi:hypothetical protein